MLIIKEKEGSKYLDEEGDFVLACCEGNLWATMLGCIIHDDVLAGVTVPVAKSPY